MMKFFMFWIPFLFLGVSKAQEGLVTRTIEVQVTESNLAVARQKLMEQAIQEISQKMIQEIVGESKFDRNRGQIQNKIIRNSGSYIPYSKMGEVVQSGDVVKMSVSLQVDVASLQKMLLAQGLFYESDATPSVLPLVRWLDRVNLRSYAWWQGQGDIKLQKYSEMQERWLAEAFGSKSFYVLKPSRNHYVNILPASMHVERPSLEDLQNLGPSLGAQIAVEGRMEISKSATQTNAYVIQVALMARQIVSGRIIGEVERRLETDRGQFDTVVDRKVTTAIEGVCLDLATQVFEAWQRGSIGANIYRLVVNGKLTPLFSEQVKQSLQGRLRQIKSVKERAISSNEVVFELESNLTASEVVKELGELTITGQRFVFDGNHEKEILYRQVR